MTELLALLYELGDYKKAVDFMNKWKQPDGKFWEEWFVEGVYVLDEATRKATHLGGKHLPVPGDPDSSMTQPATEGRKRDEHVCNRTFTQGSYDFTHSRCPDCGYLCISHDYEQPAKAERKQ